jgi:Pentapeptide repeats (8 copies)
LDFKDIVAVLAALGTLIGAVLTVLKYLSYRDKQIAAQAAFRTVVDSLSSTVEGQRLGGAILLRRFFDPRTELGEGRMPYAREAIDVIVALLRETEPGNFQKLLADGLLYAPSLEGADLQRANLQNAYLGRKEGGKAPNLQRADFYRADLSAASLKGADASRAVFYQARLHNTIFKGADLREASFYGADLLGAEFKGARLTGANFDHARNVPPQLTEFIDGTGIYQGPEVFAASTQSRAADRPQIFLSKPGTLSVLQQEFVRQVTSLLDAEQLDVATVDRSDYPNVGAVSEVRRVLSACSGVLVLGFRQLEVSKGTWRAGTEEAREVEHVALPTTWNHVEAGMAAMAGLPTLFLVERGVIDGVFALGDVGHLITDVDLARPNHPEIRRHVAAWCNSVREAGPASIRPAVPTSPS